MHDVRATKPTRRGAARAATAVLVAMSLLVSVGSARAGSVPTWDKAVSGAGRFRVLSTFDDRAVLDKETGLVWERTLSPAAVPFSGAVFACATLPVGNRRGWRVPTVEELASVMDLSQADPPVAADNPFENLVTDPDIFYWTTTPSPLLAAAKLAWNFAGPGAVADVPLNVSLRRWCVRGGQNTVE